MENCIKVYYTVLENHCCRHLGLSSKNGLSKLSQTNLRFLMRRLLSPRDSGTKSQTRNENHCRHFRQCGKVPHPCGPLPHPCEPLPHPCESLPHPCEPLLTWAPWADRVMVRLHPFRAFEDWKPLLQLFKLLKTQAECGGKNISHPIKIPVLGKRFSSAWE